MGHFLKELIHTLHNPDGENGPVDDKYKEIGFTTNLLEARMQPLGNYTFIKL